MGCQPVVAGSPAGNIFCKRNSEVTPFPGLGKLPRPAGWQPALPSNEAGITDAGYNMQPRTLSGFNCLRNNVKSSFLPGARAK